MIQKYFYTQQHCQHLCNELTLHSKGHEHEDTAHHHEQSFGSSTRLDIPNFSFKGQGGNFFYHHQGEEVPTRGWTERSV
ncbi:hypothetical protein CEXT_261331 [Caerostris extrusa]|uniref:Alpha-type protein kinase domain-containing protein n=1 Tax=Caerostris extrusa TaxID=172846 RepID=A0AAV4U0H4_CAEEX|nr:hypothetical protein CEXT_261331 [Caerostris extrusa]